MSVALILIKRQRLTHSILQYIFERHSPHILRSSEFFDFDIIHWCSQFQIGLLIISYIKFFKVCTLFLHIQICKFVQLHNFHPVQRNNLIKSHCIILARLGSNAQGCTIFCHPKCQVLHASQSKYTYIASRVSHFLRIVGSSGNLLSPNTRLYNNSTYEAVCHYVSLSTHDVICLNLWLCEEENLYL